MVTSYYIMRMTNKSKGMDIDEYYSNLHIKGLKSSHKTKPRCRVCLGDGSLSIFSVENGPGIVEALQIFANIVVDEGDEYPKHLCNICYKFIKNAISFRKVALQSDETLKKHVKTESCKYFQDTNDSSVDEFDLTDQDHTEAYLVIPPHTNKKDKMKDVKVQCTFCNKTVTSAYYKEHVTMHDPNHHKYVCDVCGKSFRLRCAYHNHSLRHRTDFAFKCQFCPYKGRYKELLKNHMRTHTGDYRYMCTECPARFLFKSNFNRHILIRHREPEHKCDSCKKAFHTKLMLKSHYDAQHLGLKNHVCNLCGKAFGYRNAMMKHQRGVHKRAKLSFSRMPSYLEAENKNLCTEDNSM